MDIWPIIGGIGVIIGIIVGVLEVYAFIQTRRTTREVAMQPDAQPIAQSSTRTALPSPLIPHNLPPRGEFVRREAEKASVIEALQSRSHLVSIEGIGGIGKTALALEVAHTLLAQSRELMRADTKVDSKRGISSRLHRRLRQALLNCGPFATDSSLQAVFADSRIGIWREMVPNAASPAERVDKLIDFLHQRQDDSQENGLILFLHVLQERQSPGDACRLRLDELSRELRQEAVQTEYPILQISPPIFRGFIWLTGKDRELTLDAFLNTIARTLEYPDIIEQAVGKKQGLVKQLLQIEPYLLIVDNYETITDEDLYKFLLELPEPTKVLITTRERKLIDARVISLKGLTNEDALALIRHTGERLALEAIAEADEAVLLPLAERTGGAPLAIKWAVGQVKQKGQSLDKVLRALREARTDIFDHIFVRSWSLLSDDARQVLMIMPTFATSASLEAIQSISNVKGAKLDTAIGQLTEMSLLETSRELKEAERRYSIHPLTRVFAAHKIDRYLADAAKHRLTDFYLAFTDQHGGFWNPAGFEQLESDLPNILEIIEWALVKGRVQEASKIFLNLSDFMTIRGYWNEVMFLSERLVEHNTRIGDDVTAAKLCTWPIAWLHRHRGDLNRAEEEASNSLQILASAGEPRELAYAKRNLGRVYQELGELDKAEPLLQEALDFYQSTGDKRLLALTTGNIAQIALERDELDVAWSLCEQVVPLMRKINDPERIGNLLDVMAHVAYRRGELSQAHSLWEEVLALMKGINRLDEVGNSLFNIAQIYVRREQLSEAQERLLEARRIYQRLGIEGRVQEIDKQLDTLVN